MIFDFILKIALYLAPMYFANSSAMLLGGKTRLDFGTKFSDNKPVFGGGKTIRGTIGGIAVGTTAGFIINLAFPVQTAYFFGDYRLLAFLLAAGAIFGDIAGSFIKRRMGVESGTEAPFLDQLDFLIGGFLLGMIVFTPEFSEFVFLCVLTFFAHKTFNFLAFRLRLKKVPW